MTFPEPGEYLIGIAGAGRMGLAVVNEAGACDDLVVSSIWVRDPNAADELATPSGAIVSSDLDHVIERDLAQAHEIDSGSGLLRHRIGC